MKKAIRILGVVTLIQFVTACASFTSPLGRKEPLDTSMAYLYGRFKLASTSSTDLSVQLVVGGETPLSIEFQELSFVSVFAVKPGAYVLNKLVYVGPIEGSVKEESLPLWVSQAFQVEPGKAYYIGDFQSHASRAPGSLYWRMEAGIEDNYHKTTASMRMRFPALRELKAFQAIYFSKRPAPEAPPPF